MLILATRLASARFENVPNIILPGAIAMLNGVLVYGGVRPRDLLVLSDTLTHLWESSKLRYPNGIFFEDFQHARVQRDGALEVHAMGTLLIFAMDPVTRLDMRAVLDRGRLGPDAQPRPVSAQFAALIKFMVGEMPLWERSIDQDIMDKHFSASIKMYFLSLLTVAHCTVRPLKMDSDDWPQNRSLIAYPARFKEGIRMLEGASSCRGLLRSLTLTLFFICSFFVFLTHT